jgi:hypothetical protein
MVSALICLEKPYPRISSPFSFKGYFLCTTSPHSATPAHYVGDTKQSDVICLQKKVHPQWVQRLNPVNPRYLGGKDQGSRPARANSLQDPISTNGWLDACLSSQLHRETQIGQDPISKITNAWAGGMVKVVEHLPSKHKLLSSMSSTEKNAPKFPITAAGGTGHCRGLVMCSGLWLFKIISFPPHRL